MQETYFQAKQQTTLHVFDTELNEWYCIKPADLGDNAYSDWPVEFDFRQQMSATPVHFKGMIAYIGGT